MIAATEVQPDWETVKGDAWFLDAGTAASLGLSIRDGWVGIAGVRCAATMRMPRRIRQARRRHNGTNCANVSVSSVGAVV